ncbi:TonB-dependent receptor domain-containing protein [Sphingomonas sp.]|uniref:TonB-dependent receptor domain-containing protein n=1 Tax=Sphingomonas sp. TaxID=28214 RepID=UPI00286C3D93|nr:TonB-dependent receptor [Sphingomonas sp.]
MTRTSIALRATASLTAMMIASASSAQTTSPTVADTTVAQADVGTEIVVTGSRIRRDPLNQDSPVVILDQNALAQTGLSAVADILQRLPSAAGGLNTKVNNSGNIGNPPDGGGVGAGSAEIDLRYLGAKRTLVLVDGLRFVNGASASGIPSTVDLNTIPASMIERIEVLQSGQSPLYGSDALSGVVNIITKSSQKGLQASGQFGTFRQGDGHTQDYNISYGIKLPTTSIVFGGSYVKQEAVRTRDRSISQFPNPGQTSCSDPVGGCSTAPLLGRYDVNGQRLTLRAPVIGRRPVYDPTLVGGDFTRFSSAARFNFAPFNYFLTPSKRYGGFVNVKQELTSNINFHVSALYSRRKSQNQAAFLPLFIGPDAGNGNLLDTITIDASNPYNPFGTLSAGNPGDPPANYSTVRRRLVEAGQRTYTQSVKTRSVTAGFDGSFEVGAHKWFWDVSAVFGSNKARQSFTGNVNAANLKRALGPVTACTAPCVPVNIFGGAGSITADQLAYITYTERNRSSQLLNDYTANLSGELFDLPAGPVGFAVGYEHRFQKGSFDPDPITAAGLSSDIPSLPASGSYRSNEFYGEVRVPLLKEVPFFYSLEFDGAVRHARFSRSGSTTTYTTSGTWKPVHDLLLRGSYATGFRAPSIGELFGAASRADAPIDDPCTNVAGSPFQTNSTVRANCIANGVPADGSYQEANGGQLGVLTGGNLNLKPETSRTLLFGGVYSPAWARGGFLRQLNLELNYYSIRVANAIAPVDAQLTLSRCAFSGDALSCAAITRTPNGLISRINAQLQNIGSIRTRGIDVIANVRTRTTEAGAFGLTINGNFLKKYTETFPAQVGFTTTSYLGTTRGFPDQSYPRFKGNGTLDWTLGAFTASFTGRYIGAVREADGKRLKSTVYGDVQLGHSFMDRRLQLTLGVNNVFNQDPPACFSCTGPNYDPTTYDVPGQFGYVRLSYKM